MGFIIRNSKHFKIDTTIRLYNALVSHTSSMHLWAPQAKCSINLIEKVQKMFLIHLYLMPTTHVFMIFKSNRYG